MNALKIQKIQNRLRNKFLKSGVKIEWSRMFFSQLIPKVGKNVIIELYVVLGKNVKIGNNVIIKSFSHFKIM